MKVFAVKQWLVLCAVLLAGCAAIGVQAPQTFNQKMLAAYSTAEGLVTTANNLAVAGKMNKQDHAFVLKRAKELRTALDTTAQLYKTNPLEAEDRLQTTIAALQILQATLTSIQPEVKK